MPSINEFNERVSRLTEKYEALITRKNRPVNDDNGVYTRYENPVITAEHAPLIWRYDFNYETNPFFMERLGVNAAFNSGAIELNGKFYLVVRVEGNDRKSFFAVAESDNGIDNFRFWDYPVLLPDTCPEETNVYDMRLTKHEDGWIYGVFCSESKDTSTGDLSAAIAQAGIVRTKDLKTWERLPNLKSKSPQQRNVVLHPEFVDGKYAFYTRPQDDFIETGSGGGVWFQSIEQKLGMDEAMYHDGEAWRRFTVIEAKRIKEFLRLPDNSGIEGLEKALRLRFYANINEDKIEIDGNTLTYTSVNCRVQRARERKGMPFHPCKSVGIIEYTEFAKAIDSRFTCECVSCYPDITDNECCCKWRFRLV